MTDLMYEANYTDRSTDDGVHIALRRSEFDRFEPTLLGLGDIRAHASGDRCIDALAAVYDLEGFTSFCDRREMTDNGVSSRIVIFALG